MQIRIYYEDTDCGGVVYYANYLRYLERARTEFLRKRGIDLAALQKKGIKFLVRHAEVEYIAPARYNDIIEVRTGHETGKASIGFSHEILRRDCLIAKASCLLVCVGHDGKPRRVPAYIKERLEQEVSGVPT